MSIRNNSNRLVNPMARQALDKFKLEAAQELNVSDEYKSGYWGNITSRECGSVGGQMVKQMVEQYENQLANGNGSAPQAQATTNQNGATATNGAQATNGQNQNNYNLSQKAGKFEPQG
ncbi:alpha/beta-type small acid-soluble spore protein [Natroniella acetigena]|uniref:alpha/beta-type small acid-soluble spore protein n=1 Tax=Natroniella acetigena TaxID=52004 RepID=UPI00200B3089|nr:alpha/beta-type small acid-soluble spore protein [Natroniella acetigena]MCK8826960.1 alpha/beta-type small acid-soluble spore protein [Natroniella acetigena]